MTYFGGEKAVQGVERGADALAPGGVGVEAGEEVVHSGFHRIEAPPPAALRA